MGAWKGLAKIVVETVVVVIEDIPHILRRVVAAPSPGAIIAWNTAALERECIRPLPRPQILHWKLSSTKISTRHQHRQQGAGPKLSFTKCWRVPRAAISFGLESFEARAPGRFSGSSAQRRYRASWWRKGWGTLKLIELLTQLLPEILPHAEREGTAQTADERTPKQWGRAQEQGGAAGPQGRTRCDAAWLLKRWAARRRTDDG